MITLEKTRDFARIVHETDNRGYITSIEISATIDTKLVKFEREWKSNRIKYTARLIRFNGDDLANWVSWDRYISERAYNRAIRAIKHDLTEVKSILENGELNPLYDQMKDVVNSYVQHYKTDFTYHDTLQLGKGVNQFLWIVRKCGTWFLSSQCEFNNCILSESIRDTNEPRFYYAGNGILQRINSALAKDVYASLPK